MKFIHYLEKVSGVEILGLVSLTIFFVFFTVMLTLVFRTNKQTLKSISQIPLDN